MHIKERLLVQAMILFNSVPFQNENFSLLKERFCSKRERILSIMSSSLVRKITFITLSDLPKMLLFFITHVRVQRQYLLCLAEDNNQLLP